jgi:hypothetical protein
MVSKDERYYGSILDAGGSMPTKTDSNKIRKSFWGSLGLEFSFGSKNKNNILTTY